LGEDVIIGAGTVLDGEMVKRCIDAGAQFIVSPGFDLETVKLAKSLGTLVMAGALTPTEVITAWKAGSDFVKIFPCGNVGGAKYIKALDGAAIWRQPGNHPRSPPLPRRHCGSAKASAGDHAGKMIPLNKAE
jgi:2-keto-3-deoxy-6-phosphogluconate aldolase